VTDHTIFALEEQNLRLDDQDGVCGVIPAGRGFDALVALYLQLGDHDKEKVHAKIKKVIETNAIAAFVNTMSTVVSQLTHPTPEGELEI